MISEKSAAIADAEKKQYRYCVEMCLYFLLLNHNLLSNVHIF